MVKYDLFDLLPGEQPSYGRSIYLLGTARDGPVNQPILVTSERQVLQTFIEGELVKAYQQAVTISNNIAIHLIRISGKYSTVKLNSNTDGYIKPNLIIRSKYAGSLYNDIVVGINEDGISFKLPETKGGATISYRWSDYPILHLLIQAINQDTKLGNNQVYISCREPTDSSVGLLGYNPSQINLSGGEDGLDIDKDERFICLEQTYEILEGIHTDIIVPLNAYFDDIYSPALYGVSKYGEQTYTSPGNYLSLVDTQNNNSPVTFHGQLSKFCERQLQSACLAHGIIGMRSIANPDSLIRQEYSYIGQLIEYSCMKTRYGLGETINDEFIDTGYFVSIVAGEIIFNAGTSAEYYDSAATAYASLVTSTNLGTSPTNKQLPHCKLRYEFSDKENEYMATIGVVTLRNSIRKGVVIYNAVTATLYDSPIHQVTNVRAIQIATILSKQALDSSVGGAVIDAVKTQQIEKNVKDVMKSLVKISILDDYTVIVDLDLATGKGHIDLAVLPRYAVEQLHINGQFIVKNRS